MDAILLLEDEPLILMDLEFAVEDLNAKPLLASTAKEALDLIAAHAGSLTAAVLDVSLGGGETCFPVAKELESRGIPFILHSGDLDRHDETVRTLNAALVAKPSPANEVIMAALAQRKINGENARS